jgi:hypothetical protein
MSFTIRLIVKTPILKTEKCFWPCFYLTVEERKAEQESNDSECNDKGIRYQLTTVDWFVDLFIGPWTGQSESPFIF